MKKKREMRVLRGLLLTLVSGVVGVLLAEGAVRVFWPGQWDTERLRESYEESFISSFVRLSEEPGLYFELRPGIDVRWLGTRIVTDEKGYCRIPPGSKAKQRGDEPGDVVRVALLGDSVSFGWRVNYEQTYGEKLRHKLEGHTGKKIELRNYSVPGYNSLHERVCLRDRVLRWQPDLIILHYDHNDADPIDILPPGHMEPEYGDNRLHSALVKLVRRRVYAKWATRFTSKPSEEAGNPERFYGSYCYAGPRYDKHLAELAGLVGLAGERGIPVLAFVFNTWVKRHEDWQKDPYYTLLHEPIVAKLERLGCVVIDSYPFSQELMAQYGWGDMRRRWVGPKDGHPNALGHEWLAGVMFAEMLKDGRIAGVFQ